MTEKITQKTKTEKISLPVEGMTCASCVARVEKSIKKLDGVESVAVNLASEKATLSIDKSKVNIAEIKKAVEEAGYKLIKVDEFLKRLDFTPTKAQTKVMSEIREDMASEKPMHRLLQGEVGSGKTIVSAYALLIAACSGHQGAIMVPTEILARQHYITLSNIFLNLGFLF